MKTSRRTFLKQATAAVAAPFILPSKVWAAEVPPSERITMGFIGMGRQNSGLMRNFIGQRESQVVAVCDVDSTRRYDAQRKANAAYGGNVVWPYDDFREIIARDDIDVVCIATPDHWHAIPTIAALEAGKDVYCEKPLTHNIHEAIAVIDAVDKYNRVLQTGSMQRSSREFRVCCELVRNGVIGDISRVECSFGPPGIPCDLPEEEMEPGLDWEMWIGPGPMRPYSSVLSPRGVHSHFPDWRKYKEYGGGMVCDWGAHHLDIAQWGLDMDESGPIEVRPPDDPNATSGAELIYRNGVRVIHKSGFGVHFYGEDGEVKVNRGRFELYLDGEKIAGHTDREEGTSLTEELNRVEQDFLADARVKLYESRSHTRDFLDCVKTRTKPITNEEVGGRSAICCHLMNQAYYHHATLEWRPRRMKFARGGGEDAWLTRDYRSPWTVA